MKILMKNDRFLRKFCKILQNLEKSLNFDEKMKKSANFEFAAVQRNVESDRSRKILKNEYSLAKFGVDTAENEPSKVWTVACLPPAPPPLIKDVCILIVSSL